MENAQVAIFEDNDLVREIYKGQLRETTHQVVAEADTLANALETIESIKLGNLVVDVILLDGNLDTKGQGFGYDAKTIVQAIQKNNLTAKVIGLSIDPMAEYGVEVDYDLTKERRIELPTVIDSL